MVYGVIEDGAVYYGVVWEKPRPFMKFLGKKDSVRIYCDNKRMSKMPSYTPSILSKKMWKYRTGTITWIYHPDRILLTHIGAYNIMLDRVTHPAIGKRLGK